LAEKMPKAPYDMNKYFSEHLRYPESARAHNIQGRVVIKFCVTEKGKIEKCSVLRGIGGGCDEEALRIVKNMPAWVPGQQDGRNVSVWVNLPIAFKAAN